MHVIALMLTGLIAAAAAVFVAEPFLRPRPQPDEHRPQLSPERALLERRDRALAALKELEFDHRTGKISDSDYRALLRPLRHEAATVLDLVASTGARRQPKRATAKHRHAHPVQPGVTKRARR